MTGRFCSMPTCVIGYPPKFGARWPPRPVWLPESPLSDYEQSHSSAEREHRARSLPTWWDGVRGTATATALSHVDDGLVELTVRTSTVSKIVLAAVSFTIRLVSLLALWIPFHRSLFLSPPREQHFVVR